METVKLKLHGYFRSSTSYRIRIALNLKGLSYETVAVNLKDGDHRTDDYKAVNPYNSVPALEVIDATGQPVFIYQSMAILAWLERTYKAMPLLPEQSDQLRYCEEFYFAIASEIHAPNNLSVLNYLKRHFGADQKAIQDWYAAWIVKTFSPVEKRLETFPWVNDNLPFGEPSVFEVVLIPQIYNARRWNVDISGFPNLEKIDAYCQTLSVFTKAHPYAQPDSTETKL